MSTQIRVTKNHYGKAGVRLLRLDRTSTPHRLLEMEVDIRLEGALTRAYTEGDNSAVVPTDTMKNTVYALARDRQPATIEEFGLRLGDHFVHQHGPITRAAIVLRETLWGPLGDAPDAFVGLGGEVRTTRVVVDGGGRRVSSGIEGLVLMKTSKSGFAGFPRDEYTTLEDTEDRLFATRLSARWDYRDSSQDFAAERERVRGLLVDTFAGHESASVQHTLHAMGEAVLKALDVVWRIRLTMPNKHYLKADLSPFGLDNPNLVFVPTDEPFGNIEATLERT